MLIAVFLPIRWQNGVFIHTIQDCPVLLGFFVTPSRDLLFSFFHVIVEIRKHRNGYMYIKMDSISKKRGNSNFELFLVYAYPHLNLAFVSEPPTLIKHISRAHNSYLIAF